jgi:hypothetical protein
MMSDYLDKPKKKKKSSSKNNDAPVKAKPVRKY